MHLLIRQPILNCGAWSTTRPLPWSLARPSGWRGRWSGDSSRSTSSEHGPSVKPFYRISSSQKVWKWNLYLYHNYPYFVLRNPNHCTEGNWNLGLGKGAANSTLVRILFITMALLFESNIFFCRNHNFLSDDDTITTTVPAWTNFSLEQVVLWTSSVIARNVRCRRCRCTRRRKPPWRRCPTRWGWSWKSIRSTSFYSIRETTRLKRRFVPDKRKTTK